MCATTLKVLTAPPRPILKREGSSCGDWESSPSSSSTKSRRRTVFFDHVTIREFAYDIGDHPWTSEGIPVCLSWEHQDETTLKLDLYETRKCSPPGFLPHVLSTQQRRDILIRAGYSPVDLQKAQSELDRARALRCQHHHPNRVSWQRWLLFGLPVRRVGSALSLRTGSRPRITAS